ncbi:MAG: hypothetical protein HOH43_06540 [Candidatus Latescibacteria bacterium]|nr:hypothetical protein [Candidatus Latescibacterota bacterium]
MDNPFPIELSEQDGNIVLRTEEWDVVRTFHMGSNENVDGQPATPHGYSVGFWQEGALVVTTKNIDWPYFDDIGTPLGADVETIETFALNADETRLDYSLTVTDSQTFTAPFTLQWPLGLGAGRRDQALQLCSLVSEGITYHALHR